MNAESPLIFISHASEDAEATKLLQQDLDDRLLGAVRFFNTSSRDSLKAGEQWLETIVSNLKESRIILPILSPAALRSPWVNFETGGAWLNGATVIPCCGGQVRRDSLPAPYSWLQAIDLDDEEGLTLLVSRIADEVGLRIRTEGLADLAERMRAVFALGQAEAFDGHGAGLNSRVDELLDLEWRYRRSDHDPHRWAATYRAKRKLKVTDSTDSIPITLTPAVEAVLFAEHPPRITLETWERSSPGNVRVAAPHARRGGRFAFRIYFEPALKADETAELAYSIDFPEYRIGVREDYVLAQLDGGRMEILDYQNNGRTIEHPTEQFDYRVVLPKELGAAPIDPLVTRNAQTFDDEQNYVRQNSDVYTVRTEDVDDEPCWVMHLSRKNPPYKARYKLRWRLPSRAELT